MGSEPGKGWNMAQEMANHHEVWVLTWSHHRSSIEEEITRHPMPNLHFIYLESPLERILWKFQLGVYIHYYLWQIQAYFIVRQLHREVSLDVIHQMVYATYKMPTLLPLLPVPFVWGPVGGGESAPKGFWQDFSFHGKVHELLRDLARWLGEHDLFVRLALQRSAVVLATTPATAQRLWKLGAKEIKVFSQVGLPKTVISDLAEYRLVDTQPVRFISIGRLLHWKGFHLGLRAFALANIEGAEYWVVGDGVERERLHRLAQELGIMPKVKFWGKLPRNETLRKLEECHVLVHPSLHESGGTVCLEAMVAGRPVICLDLGGPTILVSEETGYKVPAQYPEQVVQDIAKVMTCLAIDPKLRLKLGQAGRQRGIEVFSWETKGRFYSQIYEAILSQA